MRALVGLTMIAAFGVGITIIARCREYMIEMSIWDTLSAMCDGDTDFCRNIHVYSSIVKEGFKLYLKEFKLSPICGPLHEYK